MEAKERRRNKGITVSELRIITKDYSPMRDASNKWTGERQSYTPTLPASHMQEYTDDILISTTRQNSSSRASIYTNPLHKREAIKQHPIVYNAIQELWKLLNPFHLRGISKEVYIKVNEFIYTSVLNSIVEPTARKFAEKDAECDFGTSSFIVFSEFYDSIFELVDTYTRSTLVSEYTRVLKNIYVSIYNSHMYASLNLHSKLHLKNDDGSKVSYKPWMLALSTAGQEEKLPALLRERGNTEFVKGAPSNLARRRSTSRKKSEDGTVSRHIRRFQIIDQRLANSRSSLSKTPSRTSAFHKAPSERSALSSRLVPSERIRSDYLSRVSPLSVIRHKSPQRTADILEKVIQDRKLYKETKKQEG
jgi:hypothetical protein